MRKVLALLIALAAMVGAAGSSSGAGPGPGTLPFIGGPVVGGGGGSAVLTFQGETGYVSNQDATNSPNTFTAMPVGSAFSNREVIAVITTSGSYNGAVSAVTIGGVTASIQSYVGLGRNHS